MRIFFVKAWRFSNNQKTQIGWSPDMETIFRKNMEFFSKKLKLRISLDIEIIFRKNNDQFLKEKTVDDQFDPILRS